VSTAPQALQQVRWPEEWPYTARDFRREDESPDEEFYDLPRLAFHVDKGYIRCLKAHYAEVFPSYPEARVLDICSSWVSHYPEEKCWSHVSITGMNEVELKENPQADDFCVQNLNEDPRLPYESESFDIVTCAVSFDYLAKPLEVMREVARVLRPGGVGLLSTSNSCFPTKAVDIWTRTGTMEHVLIYGSYFHYTGEFEAPECLDLSPLQARGFGVGDPVYVIQARKKGGAGVVAQPPRPADVREPVEGLKAWLTTRGMERHYGKVSEWCKEMEVVELMEIVDSVEELVDFLGDEITDKERDRLFGKFR